MVDQTIALQVKPLDIATPLMQAAKMRQMESEQQRLTDSDNRDQVASAMRGLAPYADSPEFAGRWTQTIDDLAQRNHIRPDIAANMRSNPNVMQMHSVLRQYEDPKMGFQRDEAKRSQSNADRTFKEGVRQFDVGQETKNMPPGWVATPGGGMAFKPNGPADPKYIEQTTGAKDKTDDQIKAREAAVRARGLDPADIHNRAFILTGRFPKEDQQPLTATDKKAILEADEMVSTNTGVIDLLNQAKGLSPKAMSGPKASWRGYAASLTGEGAGQTTVDLDNLVTGNALAQLKSTFGAAPTEGERKILLELQGSSSLTDASRQKIYDRAIAAANRRLEFNKERAAELRGGTFYKSPDAKAKVGPKVGEVKDGYRFLGGDPSDKENWQALRLK